jgi:putative flippase GtrA
MPALSVRQLSESPFLRFAGVGALSTVIDLVILNLLLKVGGSIYIAGALGFFAGFSNGYFFNSRYVFKSASTSRYVKYFVVSVGGLVITELLLDLFHVRLGLGPNTAKLIAVVVVFFWNYGLSKFWAFT